MIDHGSVVPPPNERLSEGPNAGASDSTTSDSESDTTIRQNEGLEPVPLSSPPSVVPPSSVPALSEQPSQDEAHHPPEAVTLSSDDEEHHANGSARIPIPRQTSTAGSNPLKPSGHPCVSAPPPLAGGRALVSPMVREVLRNTAARRSGTEDSDHSVVVHSEVETENDVPGWVTRVAADATDTDCTATASESEIRMPPRVPRASRPNYVHVATQTAAFQIPYDRDHDVSAENEALAMEVQRLTHELERAERTMFQLAAEKAEWTAREAERGEDAEDNESVTVLTAALRSKSELVETLLKERQAYSLGQATRGPPQMMMTMAAPESHAPCGMCKRLEGLCETQNQIIRDLRAQVQAVHVESAKDREQSRKELHDLRCHMQWVYGALRESDIAGVMEKFTRQLQGMLDGVAVSRPGTAPSLTPDLRTGSSVVWSTATQPTQPYSSSLGGAHSTGGLGAFSKK